MTTIIQGAQAAAKQMQSLTAWASLQRAVNVTLQQELGKAAALTQAASRRLG